MSATLEPTKKLTLSPDQPLRQATIDAFGATLSYAVQMAHSATKDPVHAVHEYRKSIRRARAVLKLLRGELGQDYKELNGQLRDLVQRTSQLRDLDVLAKTLEGLEAPKKPKQARDRDAVLALIEAERAKRQALDVPALLLEHADTLQTMRFDLTQAMPDEYTWEGLSQGLAATYKRARRALGAAKHSREDEDIHDFRKRVKELRYQLELLSSRLEHAHIQDLQTRMGELAEGLGQVTDLLVLRDFVRAKRRALKKDPRRLLEHLDDAIERGFERCLDEFEEHFKQGAKTFSRSLLVTVLPVPSHHHPEAEGEEE